MPEMQVPLIKGDRISSDVQYRSHLKTNMYAVHNPIFGVDGFLASHQGFSKIAESPGRDRGGNYNERLGQHIRVAGNRLIQVREDGAVIDLGLIPGSGTQVSQASMPYSFNTQAIITGGRMWLWNGTMLEEVKDPDLGYPIDGCWVDGYYFLTDGEYLYHTELADETSIEPIKFATSEFSPDETIGVEKTQDNQVMVFNRYTTEFFYNNAQENFAFKRVQGKATRAGIIGTHCKTEMDGLYFCLGSGKDETPTMLIIGGGKAQNFSTREVDNILSGYTEGQLKYSIMNSRKDDCDQLIYVHLPNHTLLYNHVVASKVGKDYAWSILKSGILFNEPWLPLNMVYDRDLNAWVSGVRTQRDTSGYDAAAYADALKSINPDALWVLDEVFGSTIAIDSSGNGNDADYQGTWTNGLPSFIDDNGASTEFGEDGYFILNEAPFINSLDFATGFISDLTNTEDRRFSVKYSLGLDAAVYFKQKRQGFTVNIYSDGQVLQASLEIPHECESGDVVIFDFKIDVDGAYSYTLHVNFKEASTGSGDLPGTYSYNFDGYYEGMFDGEAIGQYFWYKDGGLDVGDVAAMKAGYEQNDGEYTTGPRGIVKLEPASGSQDGFPVEYILNTPFIRLEQTSIDKIEIETIPGLALSDVSAFLSVTYDGLNYSKEWTASYSEGMGDTGRRFIFRRIGYCRDWMGFRIRVVAAEKVAFSDMVVTYG